MNNFNQFLIKKRNKEHRMKKFKPKGHNRKKIQKKLNMKIDELDKSQLSKFMEVIDGTAHFDIPKLLKFLKMPVSETNKDLAVEAMKKVCKHLWPTKAVKVVRATDN